MLFFCRNSPIVNAVKHFFFVTDSVTTRVLDFVNGDYFQPNLSFSELIQVEYLKVLFTNKNA